MAPEELARLPVGATVRFDDELGEITRAGQTVNILWPESKCTSLIDTNSKAWSVFIDWLERAEFGVT